MIFIPTRSDDGTTDLLLPRLQKETEVFRFDIDKFRDYRWDISSFRFSMRDAALRNSAHLFTPDAALGESHAKCASRQNTSPYPNGTLSKAPSPICRRAGDGP